MKKITKKSAFNTGFEKKKIPLSLIDTKGEMSDFEKKDLKTRAAYFMLNGVSEFSVNERDDGRFDLLGGEKDFFAARFAGIRECEVRVYRFTEKNAEIFSIIEKIKEADGAMDEAYLMKRLVSEFAFTQDDVASLVGKSRPAVANTLRLLNLEPEIIGLIESGKISAGHARTLVKVPKAQQLAFAEEAIKREYSVREMERAVKAFLTPPEVLQKENEAKANEKSKQLKAFVERMRGVFRTKVSLIGNDKKGRIYIDYYSPEDLYRFEEFLDMIESYGID